VEEGIVRVEYSGVYKLGNIRNTGLKFMTIWGDLVRRQDF